MAVGKRDDDRDADVALAAMKLDVALPLMMGCMEHYAGQDDTQATLRLNSTQLASLRCGR